MAAVADNRAALGRIQSGTEDMSNSLQEANAASHKKLDALSTKTDATQSSILSLRSLAEQVASHIAHFPRELRDLLRAILRSNWQMYQVLLQVQRCTSHNPTGLLDSNIKFEDALGEYRELPYEYFGIGKYVTQLHPHCQTLAAKI